MLVRMLTQKVCLASLATSAPDHNIYSMITTCLPISGELYNYSINTGPTKFCLHPNWDSPAKGNHLSPQQPNRPNRSFYLMSM